MIHVGFGELVFCAFVFYCDARKSCMLWWSTVVKCSFLLVLRCSKDWNLWWMGKLSSTPTFSKCTKWFVLQMQDLGNKETTCTFKWVQCDITSNSCKSTLDLMQYLWFHHVLCWIASPMDNNVDAFHIHGTFIVSPTLEGIVEIIPYPLLTFWIPSSRPRVLTYIRAFECCCHPFVVPTWIWALLVVESNNNFIQNNWIYLSISLCNIPIQHWVANFERDFVPCWVERRIF
jgi:hypothetical protein